VVVGAGVLGDFGDHPDVKLELLDASHAAALLPQPIQVHPGM
jgi:hypothetical protein